VYLFSAEDIFTAFLSNRLSAHFLASIFIKIDESTVIEQC